MAPVRAVRHKTPVNTVDVIVVGAGPAGCAAARDLADAGLSVLMLDRKRFPRVKPCAGGLTVKALKRLRYSVEPVIRRVICDIALSKPGHRERLLRGRHPVVAMTVRAELDAFCLDQTLAKGPDLRIVEDIASVSEEAGGVRVITVGGEALSARYVVGADGANSRVRRLIGLAASERALAIEGHLAMPASGAPPLRFDFDRVRGGYGWIFPKGDHLNVGLYTQAPGVTVTKADLVAYAQEAVGDGRVEAMAGYPLGIGGVGYRPSGRVLLAGDAAGMAERLLGEGLHNAIKSGQSAAAAILGALAGRGEAGALHERGLRAVRADLRACASGARWLYGPGGLGWAAMVSPPGRTALMGGFAAGMTLAEILPTSPLAALYRPAAAGVAISSRS